MLSEGLVRHEFVTQTLQWGLERIRSLQLQQLGVMRGEIERRHFNYEQLVEGVEQHIPGIIGANGHYRVVLNVDKHLRWADMKEFSTGGKGPNAKVYNRIIWGVMYGSNDSVRTRFREGLKEDIRLALANKLAAALSGETNGELTVT